MVRDLLQLNNLQKRLIAALCLGICVLTVTYGVLVKRTVANTILRQDIQAEAADVAARTSDLELRYMTALREITLDRALELGFVEKKPTLFVSRDVQPLSVRYDNE